MSTIRRNLAVVIEGIGSDTSKSGGIAWHFGKASIGTPGDYEWVGGTGSQRGLIEAPKSVAVSVDPLECQLRGSAHTFRLHADNTAKALFLHRPERPGDALSVALDETETQIVFAQVGDHAWSAADDGRVVWIGDEAIRLGAWDAGGTFAGCSRGYWSSAAMAQPAGMNVWRHNPRLKHRLARLLVYDRDAGTTTQAWQGFVRDASVDGPLITLDCQDIWSAVAGAQVNRGAKRAWLTGGPGSERSAYQGRARGLASPPETRSGKRVNKTDAVRPHWMAYQAFGSLVYALLDETLDEAPLADVDGTASGGSRPAMGSPLFDLGASGAYELLVVDRLRDQASGVDAAYADMRSSSRDLDQPFHPVSLAMAILTSSYSGTSVAPAPALTLPAPSFEALIESFAPIHWWKMQENGGASIEDFGTAGNDLTLAAGADTSFSWEAAPAHCGFDYCVRATRDTDVEDGIYGAATGSGAPAIDLTTDFTFISFKRVDADGGGPDDAMDFQYLNADGPESGSTDEELSIVAFTDEGSAARIRYRDDTDEIEDSGIIPLDQIIPLAWHMQAVVWDADGGTGGDPLVVLYDFEANAAHPIRTFTWDPQTTPQPLGTKTPEADLQVLWDIFQAEVGDQHDKAHTIIIQSLLTEANLVEIAELGIAYEQHIPQPVPTALTMHGLEDYVTGTATITLDSTPGAGDLLVLFVRGQAGTAGDVDIVGWTEVGVLSNRTTVWALDAAGTETEIEVDAVGGGTRILYSLRTYDAGTWYDTGTLADAVLCSTTATGSSSHDIDAPSLTMTGSHEDGDIQVTAYGYYESANITVDVYPAGYSDGVLYKQDMGLGLHNCVVGATKYIFAPVGSENPAAFEVSVNGTWAARTVAVKGVADVLVTTGAPDALTLTGYAPTVDTA